MKTGNIIQGHVLDCNKKWLEAKLQDYDRQLYVKWNPKKRNGRGVWEVRRHPNEKTLVQRCIGFWELQYVESDIIHHVMDAEYLDHRIIDKIKQMDTWQDKNWTKTLDKKAFEYEAKKRKTNREELTYNLKQHKQYWKDLQEMVRQGRNPGDLLKGFKPT